MMDIIYNGASCSQDFKSVYGQLLVELAEQDENVVLMDADLLMASGGNVFRARFPERTFDCGIQEANMIGVAAGMSERGLIPNRGGSGTLRPISGCGRRDGQRRVPAGEGLERF